MKKILCILAAAVMVFAISPVNAQVLQQGETAPAGAIIYSLPSTTIVLKVTSQHETFVAGPYAAYSQKFLGIKARENSGDYYTIKSIEMLPCVEADPNATAAVNIGNSRNASANFLNFCNQGLIVMSDTYASMPVSWRFNNGAGSEDFLPGMPSNLDNRTTTLYKNVQTEDGFETVPVKQTQTVAKSDEKKAEETAVLIFQLRQKRMEIVTGETDATFSGEAMTATLNEISRLEKEYMSMFIGKSVKCEQVSVFDVIPSASNAKQMYIAFRFSDTKGLLPASDMQGKPYLLEIVADKEPIAPSSVSEAAMSTKGRIAYRKPNTVIVKLSDGQKTLIQSRMPVYQLGKILSFPIDVAIK